jgi:beta-glucanase (GH16 family)
VRKHIRVFCALFLILFSLCAAGNAAASVLLGDPNVESTLDSNAAGRAQAFQMTASSSGTLASLSLYVDPSSTASQIAIGLYSDSGGNPLSLLTYYVFTPQPGVWNTVSVPSVAIIAGVRYWFAVLGLGSGRPYFRDTMTGCTSVGSSSRTLTALPATWSTGAIWSACLLSAYGSGGTSSALTIAVTISPTSASLSSGSTQQFTATVTGTTNTAVTWSASGGSISSSGLYTAPSTAGTYTVTATSTADTTKSASATVAVTSATATVLLGNQNIQSTLDTNPLGMAQAFQATASNSGSLSSLALYVDSTSTANQIVLGLYSDTGGHPSSLLTQTTFTPQLGNWNTVAIPAVNIVAGIRYWIALLGTGSGQPYFRDSSSGCNSETSSSTVLSSLPATWSTGTVWAVCTLSGYGTGVLSPTTVAVSVTPTSVSLLSGGSQQFTATVTGSTNTAVSWSATGGTISSSGFYTAPSTAGTYTVTATSAADPTKSAAATVAVSAPVIAVSVSPSSASLSTGGTQQFTATVTGTTNTGVTWSATGGTISSSGLYTAPSTAGTYTVKATSVADSTKSAYATVSVQTASAYAFDDEFSGTSLDTTAWLAMNRPGDPANNELQCYLPANQTVAGGYLNLTAKAQTVVCSDGATYNYTSEMVQWKSFNFTYGTVEVRALMPGAQGTWPAIWLLGYNCQQTNITNPDACPWPQPGSDEIDIAEFKGSGTSMTNATISGNYGWQTCVSSVSDASQNWHVYRLEWSPGLLVWKIDGATTCTVTQNVPSTPMFLLLNLAVGGAGGTPSPSSFPQTMQVDYVRVTSGNTATPVAVSISPSSASLATGGTQQFTATVSGSTNTAVTWSASCGSISSGGLYTAPTTTATCTVTATSAADTTQSASATVTVSLLVQHSATLTWTASTSSGVVGYNVYRGTTSGGPYSMINSVLESSTSYIDQTVQSGMTYYYVVTAVDSSGLESAFSAEVSAAIPSP